MENLQRTTNPQDIPSLRSRTTEYPGLRPAVRWVARYSLVATSIPQVRKRARRALKEARVPIVPDAARDGDWRERAAQAIYAWITRNVEYKYDPSGVEQVQEPVATLALGEGDCDDLVSLSVAMLKAVGVPARIVVIRQTGSDVFNHIYAEYKGRPDRGGSAWKAFDVTLDQTGGPARAGDGPPPDAIARKVVVPVRGSADALAPETRQALAQLPAGDGVVPEWKLRRERENGAGDIDADSLASPPSNDMSADSKFFDSTSGSLISGGSAPGTVTATRTIADRAAAVPERQTVILVSPDQYGTLIRQRLNSGNYVCDAQGRIIIRDEEGREILPWEGGPPSEESRAQVQQAGLPGGLGTWLLGGAAVGAFLLATRDSQESDAA